MNAPDPREYLRGPLQEALAGHARGRFERGRFERGSGPPRLGDLYAFAETAELSVLWAVLERDAAGRWLAVAADPNLLVGSADVAVPAEDACGALALRCRFETRLPAAAFASARRVGGVDAKVCASARRKRECLARSESVGSLLEQETDRHPDYRSWTEEVLEKARTTLLHPPTATRARTERAPLRTVALAASVLLAVALGVILWQEQRLVDTRERLEQARPEALVNLPFAVLRPLDVRGEAEALSVPAEASLVHLILVVSDPSYPEYHLEIRERDAGAVLWRGQELTATRDTGMISVAVARDLLPAGEYRLRLSGIADDRAVPLAEYALAIRD